MKNIPKEKVITISDIFRADEIVSKDLYSSIAKFNEPSNTFSAKPNEKYPFGQDAAIFGNLLLDLNELLNVILTDLKNANPELPNYNDFRSKKDKSPAILLELGEYSSNSEELYS